LPLSLPESSPLDPARRPARRLAGLALLALAAALVPAVQSASRLSDSPSPYLREQARQPIDWHPWSAEAFEQARKSGRPVLVSVGRFGSHRNRRIENDFFSDTDVRELIEDRFVAIKLDRHETPEVAALYRDAAQLSASDEPVAVDAPLIAVVTANARPFLVRPITETLKYHLQRAALEFAEDRSQAETRAGANLALLIEALKPPQTSSALSRSGLERVIRASRARLADARRDARAGPSRPPHADLCLLLDECERKPDGELLALLTDYLERLARSGLRDHVGGGFFEDAFDGTFALPRFDKTLASNALLLEIFARAHALTGNEELRRVAAEIADWTQRDLADPFGGYRAAIDADTQDGDERFYAWSRSELDVVLGEAEAKSLLATLRLDPGGVFTRRSAAAPAPGVLELLRKRRETRTRPGQDERVFCSANGLMIGALAVSGRLLARPSDLAAAKRSASALERLGPASMLRRFRSGEQAGGSAGLDDYSSAIDGLLKLYDADENPRWVRQASALADAAIARFADPEGGFFSSDPGSQPLDVRTKDGFDGEVPNPNGVMAASLLRLERVAGNRHYGVLARQVVTTFWGEIERASAGVETLAGAAARVLGSAQAVPTRVETLPDRVRQESLAVQLSLGQSHARAGEQLHARIQLSIERPWSVVADDRRNTDLVPLAVSVLSPELQAGAVDWPTPRIFNRRWAARPVVLFEGEIAGVLPLRVTPGAAVGSHGVRVRIHYQACDTRRCRSPETAQLEVLLVVEDASRLTP
jgi:uncharacterized protein